MLWFGTTVISKPFTNCRKTPTLVKNSFWFCKLIFSLPHEMRHRTYKEQPSNVLEWRLPRETWRQSKWTWSLDAKSRSFGAWGSQRTFFLTLQSWNWGCTTKTPKRPFSNYSAQIGYKTSLNLKSQGSRLFEKFTLLGLTDVECKMAIDLI
jgi:hypothetical protein